MTDDRRRAAGPAPPSAEPQPSETLPYGVTLALPQAQGSVPPQTERPGGAPQASLPLATRSLAPHASHPHTPVHTPHIVELSRGPASAPPEPPRPAPPEHELPYAATVTPQLGGPTVDMLSPSRRGSGARSGRRSDPPPDGTLDLPAGDRAPDALPLEPGQKIGHFVIRKRLGEGGMGIVLAGHDADLGRSVAIKLVKAEADRPAYRARLLREAQAMARLEHPNVVRVYEVGSDRGRLFVAMELVDGVTLSAWLRGPRRPWRDVLAIFTQVGAGLAAVHRAGLVHRDFKPDNVLVDREGRARVADFGLARLDPEQAAAGAGSPALAVSLTRSGMMMGTPGYMAPEQQVGATVDARADQYSYCIALREALLGGRVVKLDRATWRHVPRAIRAIVERGLAFEPGERFASMDELLGALRRVERRRSAMVSVAIAALAIAAGIATTAVLMTRDRGGASGPPQPAATGAPAAPPPSPSPPPPPPGAAGAGSSWGGPPPAAGELAAPPDPPDPPDPAAGHGASPGPRERTADRGATSPGGPAPRRPAALPPPAPGAGSAAARAPRKPEAWPSHPDHLAIVRATIADLGYDGFDPDVTASEVEQLAGMEQVIGKVKLAMVERRAGRCATAVPLWTEARQAIPFTRSDASKWRARAAIGLGLCALAAGRPEEATQLAQSGWLDGNQDEIRLIMAVAFYEKGETQAAQAMFFHASQHGTPPVRAAVQTWLDRTGLVLP
jgi:predicted Ser/Thr protein kinase